MAVVVVALIDDKQPSMYSASEFSESGVADLIPSLSSPPQSLAKRAAANASQEEAGAGGGFMASCFRLGAKTKDGFFLFFPTQDRSEGGSV